MHVLSSFSPATQTTRHHAVINLLRLNPQELRELVERFGWPRYRTTQLLRWFYRRRIRRIEDMTDISETDRSTLASIGTITRCDYVEEMASSDGTRKFVLTLEDGLRVETVLIPEGRRLTLCLSTQVGCTLDCTFCLTGTMGLKRNLQAHEIVEQVLTVQDRLRSDQMLTNVVFMGMGEPLANLEALREAIERITNTTWGIGLSPRRLTLSTAGMASRMSEVSALGVNLAVSLNATTAAQRDLLMPTANRLHPLDELLTACRTYPLAPHRRLTFEYVLLAEVNDRPEDARRLAKLLHGIRCKLNLIPFNPFIGSPYRRPDDGAIMRFQELLVQAGFDVFIRKSKGRDVLGACGQLGDLAVPQPGRGSHASAQG